MTKDIGTLTGEVLLFGGVYSNLQALEAVRAVAHARGIPARNVICTGDIVGYCADPTPCIELVRDWGIHAIAGNVEMNIRDGLEDCGCNFEDNSACDLFSRIWYPYARTHSTPAAVEYMRTLPEYLTAGFAGRRLLVLHGNHESTSEFVWRSSPWSTKGPAFAKTGVDTVVAGHCGVPFAQREGGKLWLNPGVIGMPANDGTQRVWYALLGPAGEPTFHALDFDWREARRRMLDRPLPLSYALTLKTGLWDNTEIMPATEAGATGLPLTLDGTDGLTAAPPPTSAQRKTKSTMGSSYFDPKDLKRFGKIAELQPEMGRQFFEWYENATYGDTALTQREKALIALAVSHAIQCPYCIDASTTNSLQSGADEEQMMEAVHVAAAIKAGTTLIYGLQMMKQAEHLSM